MLDKSQNKQIGNDDFKTPELKTKAEAVVPAKLLKFYFTEWGITVEAATLAEATKIAKERITNKV